MSDEKTNAEKVVEAVILATGAAAIIATSFPQDFPETPVQEMVGQAADAYEAQREESED